MRIFLTELKKLFRGHIFLLILGAILILNGYLMFRISNTSESSPEDYRTIYSELSDRTDQEKMNWLDDKCSDFSGNQLYNWTVLYELQEECSRIVNYQEYLAGIDQQAKSMSSISIFSNPDTFNYRSIMTMPSKYENMHDVTPTFDISKGITLATDNNFTDAFIAFLILFSVLSFVISDREQGISGLLFSLKKGRRTLIWIKIGTLAVAIFTVILLLYAENLVISAQLYGLGDLSRPIQSLSGFIGCNLKISVLGYLFIYAAFKFLAFLAIGTILVLIAINTKNTISFYGISAIVLIFEGITVTQIQPLSQYSIFYYINILHFTNCNDIFCNFKNINFFDYPIALVPTSVCVMILIVGTCSILSGVLYSTKRNLEYTRFSMKAMIPFKHKVHSNLFYTFYQSLIMQKGAIIILIFIVVISFMSSGFIKKYDVSDVYYKFYSEQLEGDLTQEKLDFIENESDRFKVIQSQIDSIEESGVHSSELETLYKEVAPSLGFSLMQERTIVIKDMKNVEIFYDTGYKRALGVMGYDDDMQYALVCILLCIFLVSPMIANDNRHRICSVINSTKSGRRSYMRRNIFVSALYGFISAFLWMIPYGLSIYRYYGSSGLSASIHSIADFIEFPLNISVFQYLIFVFCLRLISMISIALLMLLISNLCKNNTVSTLVNFLIFALPIIIYLFGAKIMVNIGFNPLLSITVMLNDFSAIQIIIPILTLLYIIGIAIKSKIAMKL
ncbi:MAG: hypothetical protein Q4F95_02190 [Oscillospiraceae bacterium]|nr:hypothetical protein [Oscillospiraceae bacterium]